MSLSHSHTKWHNQIQPCSHPLDPTWPIDVECNHWLHLPHHHTIYCISQDNPWSMDYPGHHLRQVFLWQHQTGQKLTQANHQRLWQCHIISAIHQGKDWWACPSWSTTRCRRSHWQDTWWPWWWIQRTHTCYPSQRHAYNLWGTTWKVAKFWSFGDHPKTKPPSVSCHC